MKETHSEIIENDLDKKIDRQIEAERLYKQIFSNIGMPLKEFKELAKKYREIREQV